MVVADAWRGFTQMLRPRLVAEALQHRLVLSIRGSMLFRGMPKRRTLMKPVCAIVLIIAAATCEAAELASLQFKKVEPLVQELVFSLPQYASLKKESDAIVEPDPTSFMRTDENGRVFMDPTAMQQVSKMKSRFDIDKRIQDAMRRELILVLDSMNLEYAIVVNADEPNGILYSMAEVEDVTQKVYQALVRRLADSQPKKEMSPNQ